MQNYFSLSLFGLVSALLSNVALIPVALADDFSWTATATSAALTQQNHRVSTTYQPNKKTLNSLPSDAKITQVYANRAYAGDALVRTQLCWNGNTRCINMDGQHLNTLAFNGLDPSKPMYLIHTVVSWGPSVPPVFVTGNVNVWFTPSEVSPLEKN